MSSRSRWKLLSVLIVASAILGVVGWQQSLPQTRPPTTVTITPWTTTASATQTTVAPQRQTEWIRIWEVKPINYYLSLLESNRTAPYAQLATELRKLPDMTNATAVAKITYLALNATNPEVKHAFEIVIRTGIPDQKSLRWSVPIWNVQLQILYWLASSTDFQKDDTIPLAVAISNGIWSAVGDNEVAEAVKVDTQNLLIFLRDTDQLQSQRGLPRLADYPLEAKVALAWTGGNTATNGPHSLKNVYFKQGIKLGLKGYKWNTVEVSTLKEMREFMDREKLIAQVVDETVARLEEFFMFGGTDGWGGHWFFTLDRSSPYFNRTLVVDGEEVCTHNMQNVDFEWQFFNEHGKGIGVCDDEMALVGALCKSWGIAAISITYFNEYPTDPGHDHIVYFAPPNQWKAYSKQLNIAAKAKHPLCLLVYKPMLPSIIVSYNSEAKEYQYAVYVFCPNILGTEIQTMFNTGIPASRMRQWFWNLSTEYGS